MIARYLYFLNQQDNIKTIDHKLMVPDHSRMECDGDHGKIEKVRKKFPSTTNHPQNWITLIHFARKNKNSVISMAQEKFLNFNSLFKDKVYQMKKKIENRDVFFFYNVKFLQYTKEKMELCNTKYH